MDRCKLEYMIKNLNLEESKRIIREIDVYGNYFFKKECSKFLMNPEDPYLFEYFSEFEFFPEMKEELIEEAIVQYQKINELCVKNNIYSFFKNQTNIKECEEKRLDLVKIIQEEIVNKFFGVKGIRDYEPPKYYGNK